MQTDALPAVCSNGLLEIHAGRDQTERSEARIESVWYGKDAPLLDAMLNFYAPNAQRIVDVCCNARRMWKGSANAGLVVGYDIDPAMKPDVVVGWDSMPDASGTVDVLVYDPPHMPTAAASPKSLQRYAKDYGLGRSCGGDNVAILHAPFLAEAKRVLRPDGLIFAKIKDYIHNHKYQWNLEYFNQAVRAAGLTPCDLIIKRDPCGGNLKSGRWIKAHHAKNVHCYWAIVRNGGCEPKRSGSSPACISNEPSQLPRPGTRSQDSQPRRHGGSGLAGLPCWAFLNNIRQH